MELLRLAIELIKVLAWPVVTAILVWRLGPPIVEALKGRPVNLEGFGLKATIGQTTEQQQLAESPAGKPALAPPAGAVLTGRPAIRILEQRLRIDLEQYPVAQRESTLLTALAIAFVNGKHEAHYNRIFGSQIAGLRRLEQVGSVAVEEARQFFQPYAQAYPQIYASYGFDGWLGFMINAELIARDGDRLTSTAFGHDFLLYITDCRLTEAKPG